MVVNDATATVAEQALSAVKATQESIVNLIKPFAALAEPLLDTAASLPFADQIPSPASTVEQWYGFVADALSAQKDFVVSLLDLIPVGTSPAAKSA